MRAIAAVASLDEERRPVPLNLLLTSSSVHPHLSSLQGTKEQPARSPLIHALALLQHCTGVVQPPVPRNSLQHRCTGDCAPEVKETRRVGHWVKASATDIGPPAAFSFRWSTRSEAYEIGARMRKIWSRWWECGVVEVHAGFGDVRYVRVNPEQHLFKEAIQAKGGQTAT